MTLVLSTFRRQIMRFLMIKHAAKITAINPSAARFALDEMLGFVLVRISVLGNIFSARDFHSPLFDLCFSHCLSLRDGLNTRSTFRFSARIILERFPVDVNRNSKGVPRGAQIRFGLL